MKRKRDETLTPTQLRNARKRAAKKRTKQQSRLIDPSLVYIEAPLAAPVVKSAEGFFGALGHPLPLRLGPLKGWRSSAKLAVRACSGGGVEIGLFLAKSHDVVPVAGCAAHHPSINSALEAISAACKSAKLRGYDESTGEGDLRYLKLEVQRSSGLVQLTLVWRAASQQAAGRPLARLLAQLRRRDLWYAIWANFNTADKHTSRILSYDEESWVQLAGNKNFLREQLLSLPLQPKLCFPPFVFRQANLCAFEEIVAAVRRFVPKDSAVVELYGGVGTIGLHLADLVSALVCSDENPHNRLCFRRSAKGLPEDMPWGKLVKADIDEAREDKEDWQDAQARVIALQEEAQAHSRKALSQRVAGVLLERKRELQRGEMKESRLAAECNSLSATIMQMRLQEWQLIEEVRVAEEELSALRRAVRQQRAEKEEMEVDLSALRRQCEEMTEVEELKLKLQRWKELVNLREQRAEQLREQAEDLELDAERCGWRAEFLRAKARGCAWGASTEGRRAELAVAAGHQRRAANARDLATFLPLLAALVTMMTHLYRLQRLSYVPGDAASQVDSLSCADVVIVDPPRKGLDDAVIDALQRHGRLGRVIYVSCGFPAFRRDAERLLEAKWAAGQPSGMVVGGADKGGILVRAGQGTGSEQLAERLSTGAIVEELDLAGDRLHYQLVTGTGPASGWVSVTLKDKALLVRKTEPQAQVEPAVELKEGDYYVTLGVVFKKAGTDPETQKIVKLNRKVGAVVHTTGKVWKGPTGGFWVELDVSSGDSGAGEKPGYVMIDASGFGTPGPCLQKASKEDGEKVLLTAKKPAAAKAWDGSGGDKEFLVFEQTKVADMKIILGMLFGLKPPIKLAKDVPDSATVKEAGLASGDAVVFEGVGVQAMRLVVMSPLEQGVKLTDLEIQQDWTVGQVRKLLCSITGLKEGSMLMAKGKMGERVGEDAQLNLSHLVVDCGYKDGDEIGFIYMGDPEADLQGFLSKK
ncbi:unnamed protein product [Effrenium voratum]|uniref:Uncharacterized protein n=1 Tax=Effrenium voratum TaxID=2562239 RepID=A0AA36NCW5_9DINO|nr:unnamed protein product [Effrenium voratum]